VQSFPPSSDGFVAEKWKCVSFLRVYASRILGVVVNSGGLGRVFKAFKQTHSPKHNRLGTGRLPLLGSNKITALTKLYFKISEEYQSVSYRDPYTGEMVRPTKKAACAPAAPLTEAAQAAYHAASFAAIDASRGDDDLALQLSALDADDDLVGGPVLAVSAAVRVWYVCCSPADHCL
jgi:hypothetical protein